MRDAFEDHQIASTFKALSCHRIDDIATYDFCTNFKPTAEYLLFQGIVLLAYVLDERPSLAAAASAATRVVAHMAPTEWNGMYDGIGASKETPH